MFTSARAIATRCCWPPESWFGWWWSRSPRPTAFSASRRPLRRSAARDARVEQRQLDVLERGRARQQVEALEHEADLLVADMRQLRVSSAATSRPSSRYALGRLIEAAEQVHERRLARARRPDEHDELARGTSSVMPRKA